MGYGDRHQRTGAISDLDIAIQRLQEALDATSEDHPDLLSRRLHSLGVGYQDRYTRTRATLDLETAIERFQEALDATPKKHSELAGRLQSLGVGYQNRYRRTGSTLDLERAIQRLEESLNATPENHSDSLAERLYNLGNVYGDRYLETKAMGDLEIAIQRLQESLDVTSNRHPDLLPRCIHSLGVRYQDRYKRTGAIADLDTAIRRFQQSLDTTLQQHPNRAGRLYSLGNGHQDRYRATEVTTDLETAIQCYQQAIEQFSSPVLDRFRSTLPLLELHAEAEDWPSAYLAAYAGVSLIPLLILRSLENADKQYLLTEITGLASDAAAVALMAEKLPYEAVQLLELGRGIISGSLRELRADISDLQHKHPRIAEEYIQLRNQLLTPTRYEFQGNLLDAPTALESQIDMRYNAGRKIEQMIQTIRKLPGFDRFLLSLSEDELKAAASQGPIVIINVSEYRCDALIVEQHQIRGLKLPRLHADEARDHAAALNPDSVDTKLLEWLWETTAEPVLDVLGFCESPHKIWPRIWWIPTGPLTKFPFHAAGYHSRGSDTVLDRVISSYSSSIRLLFHSRQDAARPKVTQAPEKVVLVGMSELPHALREIKELKDLCNGMNLKVRQPQTIRQDVIASLSDCDIFHFAGHGRANPLDPLKSALVLSDNVLTVSNLFGINAHNSNPFLTYLSACGTGQVKHDALMDEGLHLIAACQLAGFQHIIGTLWEVNDSSCVDVAMLTYKFMLGRNMSHESVSEGLHHACRKLRDEWVTENVVQAVARDTMGLREEVRVVQERSRSSQSILRDARDARDVVSCDDTPLHWVPYVHFGI